MSNELPVCFECSGEQLYSVVHLAEYPAPCGVLIVVGGPQYRVGSHRQFVLLARDLALAGFPVMRFDYRGMGDSEGETGIPEPCEHVEKDIRRAIDVFFEQAPGLEKVVLWGLCDGATAALLYARCDRRVAGIVLLNPWLGTEQGAAKAYLKHYYLDRLRDPELWRKIRRREFSLGTSIASLLRTASAAVGLKRPAAKVSCAIPDTMDGTMRAEHMAEGLEQFHGPVLLILSGNDHIAAEFRTVTSESRKWRKLLNASRVTQRDFPEADHTFSRREWRDQVAAWTRDWLRYL